ncbi:putative cyclin-D6-1 G1/S-specific cyclin-D6-1 [Vigna angularis]|uniref:B-like cyclin n=1 Tax=Phaseolus angularis TaxID=3914 RepID=A0A8T0KBF7_PHAAN|nr:putative cyclin-D6-1 G1/S-specific cyclin-D6-1 [Vigna angularis]
MSLETPMAKTLQIIPKPDHGQVKRDVSDTLPFFIIIGNRSKGIRSTRGPLTLDANDRDITALCRHPIIKDIKKGKMEFDLEDPLVSLEEEQPFTVSELFASESDHMPSPNYLSLTHFHVFCFEAISLILQVQLSYKLDPFVAYLAINYMHRFTSSQEIPKGNPWYLRLVVVSCLSLASKMKNTTLPFLEMLKEAEIDDHSLKQALKERASAIIFNAQNDIKLLEYKPSTIAATALIIASHELLPHQYSILRASIISSEYLDEETLSKCFDLMQEMIRTVAKELDTERCFLRTETPGSVLERNTKRQRI